MGTGSSTEKKYGVQWPMIQLFLTRRTTMWDFHILFSPFVIHDGLALGF